MLYGSGFRETQYFELAKGTTWAPKQLHGTPFGLKGKSNILAEPFTYRETRMGKHLLSRTSNSQAETRIDWMSIIPQKG